MFRPQFAAIDSLDQLEQDPRVFTVLPNGESKAIEQCSVTQGFDRNS